ncbi:hypothetical protein VPH35_080816 [Triticum aestivum]|uniref:uncharacterized protein n=1 Tax=Triticum aestivum TaxID=4565 RepID=UPI001D01F729|nr:uncharacterized protein LOC123106267 [Triticum aestivum]
MRADLLPLSFAGLFVHFMEHKYPEFFARPSSSSSGDAISGDLSFLPSTGPRAGTIWEHSDDWHGYNIEDHCNGLLLLSKNCVVNPATRQWNAFPPCPAQDCTRWNMWYSSHLVYDPMISPHYEVLMIPCLRDNNDRICDEDEADLSMEESEWPLSPCKMYVFSSRTSCWEDKYFVREGGAARTVGEMRVGWQEFNEAAVYFRRALYMHCGAAFLMRISLSDNAYRVIKTPIVMKVDGSLDINIAKSKKGVYLVAFEEDKCLLRVWILNESCGQMEWMLKDDIDLNPVLVRHRFNQRVRGHWILEDINYNWFRSIRSLNDFKEASTEQIYEWDSDNDDVQDCYYHNKESHDDNKSYDIQILGFHPYREILFLSESSETGITGLAYHLNGSKIEVLGNICPKGYSYFNMNDDIQYFMSSPYTPCWTGEFPPKN